MRSILAFVFVLAAPLTIPLGGCGDVARPTPPDAAPADGGPDTGLTPVEPANLVEFEEECVRQRSCADCQRVRFVGYGGCGWDAARGGVCRFGTGPAPRDAHDWWWGVCPD